MLFVKALELRITRSQIIHNHLIWIVVILVRNMVICNREILSRRSMDGGFVSDLDETSARSGAITGPSVSIVALVEPVDSLGNSGAHSLQRQTIIIVSNKKWLTSTLMIAMLIALVYVHI